MKRVTRKESDRRLLGLAKILYKLPPERFDYTRWVGDSWKGAPDLSCGTTACALGWATTMPEAQADGLVLIRERPGYMGHVELLDEVDRFGGTLMHCSAGAKFFGLPIRYAALLFLPNGRAKVGGVFFEAPGDNATPKQVAKLIRSFVKARSAATA